MLNWSLYILLVYGLCSHPKLSLDGLVQGLEFVRGREYFVGLSILLVYGLWCHPEFSLDGLVQGLEFVRGIEYIVGPSILLGYVLILNLALMAWCRGWSLKEEESTLLVYLYYLFTVYGLTLNLALMAWCRGWSL